MDRGLPEVTILKDRGIRVQKRGKYGRKEQRGTILKEKRNRDNWVQKSDSFGGTEVFISSRGTAVERWREERKRERFRSRRGAAWEKRDRYSGPEERHLWREEGIWVQKSHSCGGKRYAWNTSLSSVSAEHRQGYH